MKLITQTIGFVVIAIAVFLYADAAWACPGCKQALATADGEQANMVNGYFWSILFMLSMPFTVLGAFAGSMYLAVRKARRRQMTADSAMSLTTSATTT